MDENYKKAIQERLDNFEKQISEASDIPLFQEVRQCLLNACYRAAYVMTWVCVAESIRNKLFKLRDNDPDIESAVISIENKDKEGGSTDEKILESSKYIGISKIDKNKLDHIWKRRNLYAHPTAKSPLVEEVMYAIAETVNLVLSKPPMIKRDIIPELMKKLFEQKNFFDLENSEKIEDYAYSLSNRFLEDDLAYFIDENKFNEMRRFELHSGDLIMSCSGTMGKIAIAPENIKKGIINQALLKLSTSKQISNVFLKLWMQSESFQENLRIYSQGAAIKNVASVAILKNVEIILPSLSEQNLIVDYIQEMSGKYEYLKSKLTQRLEHLKALKASILDSAFRGAL